MTDQNTVPREKARLAPAQEAAKVGGRNLGTKFEPNMNIYSTPGTRVRFRAGGGSDSEKEAAFKAGFVKNELYTVKRCDVDHSSTRVLFDEIEGRWNSCLFADLAPLGAESKTSASVGVEPVARDQVMQAAAEAFGYQFGLQTIDEGDLMRFDDELTDEARKLNGLMLAVWACAKPQPDVPREKLEELLGKCLPYIRAAALASPAPAPGAPAGWINVVDRLPVCNHEDIFIGINTAGFAGAFNAIQEIDGTLYCLYYTPEKQHSVMSDLQCWQRMPAAPGQEAAAVQAVGADAQDVAIGGLLCRLVDQLGERDRGNGNAPWHGHDVPGVWDSDNGAKAGTDCAWCALWAEAKKVRAALRPGAGEKTS